MGSGVNTTIINQNGLPNSKAIIAVAIDNVTIKQ
jgi:hypothetical protein